MNQPFKQDLLSPIYDVTFKLIFADPQNEPLLKSLLAAILEQPVSQLGPIKYLNSEILPAEIGDKFSRLDLRLDVAGRQVDVEIQKSREKDFKQRALYYWSCIYRRELKKGERATKLAPVICINLLNFQMFDCESYVSDFGVRERTRHELLHEDLQIIMLELTKIPRVTDKTTDDMKLLWMQFFSAKREEEFTLLESVGNQEISAAVERIRHYSADEKIRALAQREEERQQEEARALANSHSDGKDEGLAEGLAKGLSEGLAKGKAEGMAEGEQKKAREVAWLLLQKGLTIDFISESTGLSVEQIILLQQQSGGNMQN